jgi:hypothetical protein
VEQRGIEPLTSALNQTLGKNISNCLSKVAATEEKSRFSGSFPFLTIKYAPRAVIFGHVLAAWLLGES